MRWQMWGWLLGFTLLAFACGGKVIVDGQGDYGAGGAGGGGTTTGGTTTGGTTTGTASSSSSSSSSSGSSSGGPGMSCAGKECGASCTVCNNVECIQGKCDSFGICEPKQPSCP